MRICPKCGAPVDDDSIFCTGCGCRIENVNSQQNSCNCENVNSQQNSYNYENVNSQLNPNKIFTLIPYALGVVGSIISILAAKDSAEVMFHVKEALKLDMLTIIVGVITALLAWTLIVPIAGGICIIILLVARIISFVNACKNEIKPAPIVSAFKFFN